MPYSKHPERVCDNCGETFHCKTISKFCDKCRYVTRNCLYCGIEFTSHRKDDIHCCCRSHAESYKHRNAEADRSARRPPCANCGKPITRVGWDYGKNSNNRNFCSKACYSEWQTKTEEFRGPNHPRWKGGYQGYYGASWPRQRELARKRDKVCQRCGKTPRQNGKALDVHHIIPFRKFGVKNSAEAHQLSNLICYCTSCHQLAENDS